MAGVINPIGDEEFDHLFVVVIPRNGDMTLLKLLSAADNAERLQRYSAAGMRTVELSFAVVALAATVLVRFYRSS